MTLKNNIAEPIAIIGIGCRFPGGVNSPESYWELLSKEVDAITEIPSDRWSISNFYSSNKVNQGKSNSMWGGFLDNVDQFDASFFGISPREAALLDPQQRLLLEVCWEAMENSGQMQERLAGTNVGVFMGAFTLDYKLLQFSESNRHLVDAHSATGAMMTLLANRISYTYDFRGPSITVDTACSSSLVALHLACQSIRNGESTMAFAGGVNVMIKPEYFIAESKAGMLSADGRSKAFDSSANGYVRGEGAGVVLLKPLSQAIQDNDPIHAIIRGSGINQDGNSQGITVPREEAQKQLLCDVYEKSGIKPSQVQYVEAHGTGTPVGDPIEANALGSILGADRVPGDKCYIGSVKTNIGHTEAAAGVAGLIKTILCLKNRQIPAHLHLKNANPDIDFEKLNIKIPTKLTAWPDTEDVATASVNSFGFGGTNAHVVLQEYVTKETIQDIEKTEDVQTIVLSARNGQALKDYAKDFKKAISANNYSLSDIGYNAIKRRSHHNHRLAITAKTVDDLIEKLDIFLGNGKEAGIVSGVADNKKSPLSFVFTGMGPQWWAMGRELLQKDDVFRQAVEQCDDLFKRLSGWSIIEAMLADEQSSKMEETEVAQPANFMLQVGLAELWKSWGIAPDAIVGHSAGEVAAAYCAGVYSLEDAVKIIYYRSNLQQRTTGLGQMVAVGLSFEEARIEILDLDHVSIAAINSPNAVTLAGAPESLDIVIESLEKKKIFYKYLNVKVPYHSHYMDPLKDDILNALKDIKVNTPHTPIYSTVTGKIMSNEDFTAYYWWKNIRESVLFAAAANTMIEDGIDNFIEVGPHPVLANSISECLSLNNVQGLIIPSLRRNAVDKEILFESLGALYSKGYSINWDNIHNQAVRTICFPTYPWQRERYWQESFISEQERLGTHVHSLLGKKLNTPEPTWENDLDLNRLPYLCDHQIQGAYVYPGAAYVEMMLAASKELFGDTGFICGESVKFNKALFLTLGESVKLRLVYSVENSTVSIYSQPTGVSQDWTLHATGQIRPNVSVKSQNKELLVLKENCTLQLSKEQCYLQFRKFGLEYGETFQGIETLWQGEQEALAKVSLHEIIGAQLDEYEIHPSILDLCFQVLAAALPFQTEEENTTVYMPVGVSKGALHKKVRLDTDLWIHASILNKTETSLEGDIHLFDSEGNIVMEILGCNAVSLKDNTSSSKSTGTQDIYELQWHTQIRKEATEYSPVNNVSDKGYWVIFEDKQKIGHSVAERLIKAGEHCYSVHPGAKYERTNNTFTINPSNSEDFVILMDDILSDPTQCRGIIYGWALDNKVTDILNTNGLNQVEELGCVGLLHLVQSIVHKQLPEHVRLWVATIGAQQVGTELSLNNVAQSAVWGLAKAIGHQEHMNLWGGIIDLDDSLLAEKNSNLLFEEIWNTDGEDHVAFRQGERYVVRLEEDIQLNNSLPIVFRPDASYLITGGFGGLGLLTARWMIKKGARHLILMGRGQFHDRTDWDKVDINSVEGKRIIAIKELEAMGATIHIATADVCNKNEIEKSLLQYSGAGWPEIRGVIHTAGVARPQLLYQMNQQEFTDVLRPKMIGGWNLHEHFENQSLDFFVLFSSIASVVVMSGQANYSAGNAFLDGLAHYRRSRGMHGLSINWGPWLESGMATQLDLLNYFDNRGLYSMTNDQGLEALNQLLCQQRAQFSVVGADWPKVADKNYPLGNVPPIIAELVNKHRDLQSQTDNSDDNSLDFLNSLLQLKDRKEQLTQLESHIMEMSCAVLRLNRIQIEANVPLNAFGLDSMMAMELKNTIEASLQVTIAVVDLLRGVTSQELSINIMEMLEKKHNLIQDDEVGQIISELGELSEDKINDIISLVAAGRDQIE
ncbi:acyl transferase domain-containing protein/acyl carrier protein [Lysinibacillus parviboronicapiens]|uniref:Acyl transferase domain-containing protein/acyl carrier protein n=1 Tax=Lysinibacillus parviboronicapiens TaxID=436516 RepID=A0ABV2PFD7_9BACI